MWQDHRQDRRGWESVLYRMVGRGALWTEDEIKTMAGYLASAYGRQPVQPVAVVPAKTSESEFRGTGQAGTQ